MQNHRKTHMNSIKYTIVVGLEVSFFVRATEMFCQQLNWSNLVSLFQAPLLYSSTLWDVVAAITVVMLPLSWPVRLHICATRLPTKEHIDSLGRDEHIDSLGRHEHIDRWTHLLDSNQAVESRRAKRCSPVRLDLSHRREASLDQGIGEVHHVKDESQSRDALVALAVVGVGSSPRCQRAAAPSGWVRLIASSYATPEVAHPCHTPGWWRSGQQRTRPSRCHTHATAPVHLVTCWCRGWRLH